MMINNSESSIDCHYKEIKMATETLKHFQNMLLKCATISKTEIEEALNELFSFLKEINIPADFMIYESFIRLLAHISITKNNKDNQPIFISIIDELIHNYSLKSSFHSSTLFYIFKKNPVILLYLYEQKIIEIQEIRNEILTSYNIDTKLFIFFLPEIQKNCRDLYQSKAKLFRIKMEISKYYSKDKKKSFIHDRKECHSNEEIARIIRNDDIESFIEAISRSYDSDLNAKVHNSYFEINDEINNRDEGLSFLEYSMAFGSINIFKYLIMNKAVCFHYSIKYAFIGGNNEIIHILEEKSQNKFNLECLITAIKYYHEDIINYLITMYDIEIPISKLIKYSYDKFNFQMANMALVTFIENKTDNENDNNILKMNEFQNIIEEYTFHTKSLKIYLLYYYCIQHPKIDVYRFDRVLIL
ncbi:hypothetical protein TRFO_11033 [Tritrichomonas foetus]|uniref:DUF3447 domain-containing protein n=1 Tax=Tritrichomonas foetus TaxID=1144522 RepID=A0A1J4J7K7_9EUKA|nr:hypothetical protein TRFO_11033 [Tritrichomonas foetus]|eukprot:OHS94641.1 hypothetical protein TRFO_11033 [Tritrichomonas foetus]